MNQEWYFDLMDRYSNLLKELYYIECNSGWKTVLDCLFLNLIRHEAHFTHLEDYVPLSIIQVKEKFGGLRVYMEGGSIDDIRIEAFTRLVEAAEKEAYTVCELCGSKQNVKTIANAHRYVQTSCEKCFKNVEILLKKTV